MAIDTGVESVGAPSGSTVEGVEANLIFWVGGVEAGRVRKGGKVACGQRAGAIASPSGGAVVDTEARAAIVLIIAAMQAFNITA